MRFYPGADLADVGTPGLSWRRLRVLLTHLPRESALLRELHGADVEWGLKEHLLAAVFDAVQLLLWQNGGDKHAKKPSPIPRPGVTDDRKKTTKIGGTTVRTPAEIEAILARVREPEGGVTDVS